MTAANVSVEDLWVPANRVAAGIAAVSGDSPNLRFPRGPRLAYNKVAVALGTLRAALDAAIIRQQVTVAPHHLEDAGRRLFGLAPQEVMLRGITDD